MPRRLLLAAVLAAVLSLPAAAGAGLSDRKAALDARLANVRATIERQQAKASQLQAQIGSLTGQIRTLQARVGDVSQRLSALQEDLDLHRRRLDKLTELYRLQTARFVALKHEYSLALQRLNLRLVDLYKQPQPTAVDIALQARSFQDVLDELDDLNIVATQDKRVAAQVGVAKHQVRVARRETRTMKQGVQREANVLAARAQQAAILRGELLSSKSKLADARSSKSHTLVITKQQVQDEIRESQAIAAASDAIAAKLRAREADAPGGGGGATGSTGSGAAPAGGFIWPVSAPITSPFGMRWGTLHPGIDIGVPSGTPVHAAASGTVIWCGWMSGYGNLVMIDHHNGLVTLYGHNTSVAVSCNQEVSQGQVVSYSGCTGFCTGPHVHFEVRLHGSPVDPLGYLP
jgi:murein DD-endopeptidase MepM/ murein hydrolase activator NlpD